MHSTSSMEQLSRLATNTCEKYVSNVTSKSDIVKDGDIVANHSCLSYDQTGSMVQQNALAYFGCRVNIHC